MGQLFWFFDFDKEGPIKMDTKEAWQAAFLKGCLMGGIAILQSSLHETWTNLCGKSIHV